MKKKASQFLATVTVAWGLSSPGKALPIINSKLPMIELANEKGGLTDGSKWSSDMIKDHIWLLFYVDPDHKDDNTNLEKALKKEAFPEDSFGTIAIINMAATWLPDVVLKPALKEKQEAYPRVTYVLDRSKSVLSQWKLADDDYNVLIVDHQNQVLYAKQGVLSSHDIQDVISIIRKNLAPPQEAKNKTDDNNH